jgi:hypothetical protein
LEAFQEGNSCLLSGGAPDSPVHHRTSPIHCPVQIAFLNWRTGQSGAPPDIPYSLSGAHWTVWSPHQTVGSATHHARIARPTVGAADRWLTVQSGAPPDSPVNFSRTPPTNSREWPVDQTPAWRTRHCPVHTGQSGAPIKPLARPRVTRGLRGRPLARPTVGSLDCPVYHRTVR